MKKLIFSIIAVLTASSIKAADELPTVSYYLPATAVRMSVLVEHTVFTPGELAQYSELYLKESVNNKKEETYRIVSVGFTPVAVPDTSRHYTITLDKKHSIINLSRDRNGVLCAINAQPLQAPALPANFQPAKQQRPLNPHDYMSQDILSAGNSNTMSRMVAQEIYDIRESRSSLSRGEADYMPKDGEQLKLMMSQMDLQERALRQAFVGNTVTDTAEYVVTFVPSPQMERQMLFRFSKHFGLVDLDDLSGEPVYAVTEDLMIHETAPAISEDIKKQKDTLVIPVVLPGKINLNITMGGDVLGKTEMHAAQYGPVEQLPGAMWGKKQITHIVLDPLTGSIKTLETEPLQ